MSEVVQTIKRWARAEAQSRPNLNIRSPADRQTRLLEEQGCAPRGVAPEVVGDAVHGRDERRAPREGGARVSRRD